MLLHQSNSCNLVVELIRSLPNAVAGSPAGDFLWLGFEDHSRILPFSSFSFQAFYMWHSIHGMPEESSESVPMAYTKTKSVRFSGDIEAAAGCKRSNFKNSNKHPYKFDRARRYVSGSKVRPEKPNKSFKEKVLARVFSEDYESLMNNERILFDPRGPVINRWNKIFLIACLASLFLDPLFFYLLETRKMECIDIGISLEVALTIIRSFMDIFYGIHIFVRFRTAFVAPSSRVFGRGELVIDSSRIALRYLSRSFWLDIIAALPLPQLLIWVVIPNMDGSTITNTKNFLRFTMVIQYLPRLFLIFPLSGQIVKATGVMTETAWAGAAYNLILYMLASHVLGSSWYLLSIQRQESCWREACRLESLSCQYSYFDCKILHHANNLSNRHNIGVLSDLCNPTNNFYQFGIYAEALNSNVTSSPFLQKYFYCFWWGLKNLSCLGQNLSTSTYIGEISFAIVIAILGLVLFGLLIGNVQSYLQSTTARLEEWRIKKTDTEQWMRHRQLPAELKQCVRRYHQYRWVATRGVDEEALLACLPMDLRRDIKRHLCLDLVRQVPLFDEMDERMLEAICARLKPALYTRGTCLVRELDPVNEMVFIIRGYLDSNTTNGGRTGFFNSCRIGAGEFCGEELLTWALDPRPTVTLPLSTRTVLAVSDVEAFALVAEDLKFVASQFRRLHSKQLRHKFRFYSHQWRTWAACFIQAAWRRQKRRRASMELLHMEEYGYGNERCAAGGVGHPVVHSCTKAAGSEPPPVAGANAFVARLVASASQRRGEASSDYGKATKSLRKPKEPDFSMQEGDDDDEDGEEK